MTKYFCDFCGEEVDRTEAIRFTVTYRKTGYSEFNEDILLHENCAEEALESIIRFSDGIKLSLPF